MIEENEKKRKKKMLSVLQITEDAATPKFDLIETSNLSDHVVNTLPNLLSALILILNLFHYFFLV